MENSPHANVPSAPTSESISVNDHLSHSRQNTHPSPGVQAAQNRLRQLRRDLLELSDNPQARTAELDMVDPGHEAIILTGSSFEGRQTSPVPEDQNSSNSASNSRSDNRPQHTARILSHPVGLSSPLMAPRLRRPTIESQLRLSRNADPDDPNTLLGRRVAARLATRTDHQSSRSLQQLHSLPEPPPTVLESTLFPQHSLSLDGVLAAQATSADHHDAFERRRIMLSSQALFAARTPLPLRHSSETQTSNPELPAQQQNQSDRPDRLSLLSNFSVQNFSSPRSSTLARPLLFDEPTSYVEQDSSQYSSTLDPLIEDETATRSYIIHRRLNADGEEFVHSINLDWREDMRVENVNNDRSSHQPHSSTVLSLQDPAGRRRGWARLDADGNEISVDEEEQIERLRTTYRMRALQRARNTTAGATHHDNTDDWDDPADGQSNFEILHCRYNSIGEKCNNRRHIASIHPVFPFHPDPLPMPLSRMVDCGRPSTGPQKGDFILVLPPTAGLAGR